MPDKTLELLKQKILESEQRRLKERPMGIEEMKRNIRSSPKAETQPTDNTRIVNEYRKPEQRYLSSKTYLSQDRTDNQKKNDKLIATDKKIKEVGNTMKNVGKTIINAGAVIPSPYQPTFSAIATGMDVKDGIDAFNEGDYTGATLNGVAAALPYVNKWARINKSKPDIYVNPTSVARSRHFTNNPTSQLPANLTPTFIDRVKAGTLNTRTLYNNLIPNDKYLVRQIGDNAENMSDALVGMDELVGKSKEQIKIIRQIPKKIRRE